ncbi:MULTISPECIES: histidine phosphatase family protein [Halocynthiibacter]|uniref:Histidine phosphatase family protein n=1 Tax=Halocynthiibacter halioticoli TaxID=2986804 RepID=A0AAE3LUL1_9RHOB|nr:MULTISPECIES: histidine phosphatase family protein [Halocynthiibacter]MCV6824625.1 histidine phosphatase family protein [Halocynthiibacter halioticoli]MCW4057626.1 histidine phosphatase family protein [Halocynthiibacter sp. SDUM655004]
MPGKPLKTPPLFILRHGQTEWNLAGRLQGSLDSPLTSQGIQQAETQSRLLTAVFQEFAQVDVFVSPLGRAQQTAKIALAPHGIDAIVDARLAEVDAGDFQRKTHKDIEKEWPDIVERCADDFSFYLNAPNGEGEAQLRGRCLSFLNSLTKPSVLITHGITSTMLRGLACNLSFLEMRALPHTQGCIFRISGGEEVILKEAK